MLRRTQLMWRRPARQGGRRPSTPKFLASLPTPSIKRSWHQLGDLTAAEKTEIATGAWRSATPVQLVPDAEDRREALLRSPSENPAAPTAGDATPADPPLVFPSDEAADAYLREEAEDEHQESGIPSLRLAHDFFHELATMADEEIDGELDGMQVPKPKSDEERRQEALDVHRQFFGEYYTVQGLIADPQHSPEKESGAEEEPTGATHRLPLQERYAFIDAMLRPAQALFQVNPDKVLARLTTRDQLECDSSCVFGATPDPLMYQVALMPTQPVGDPLRLPYTAETSILAQREAQEGETDRHASVGIESAEALALLLGEEDVTAAPLEPTTMSAKETVVATTDTAAATEVTAVSDNTAPLTQVAVRVPSPPPARPPSVGQLHWLQRLVAADVVANVNALSPILSLLAVRLASHPMAQAVEGDGAPRVIFDPFGLGQRATQSASYYKDIAQRASLMREMEEGQERTAIDHIVVAVALPAPSRAQAGRRQPQQRRRMASRGADDPLSGEEMYSASSDLGRGNDISRVHHDENHVPPTASIPLADRGVNLVFLEPSTSGKRGWPHCRQLLGRCHVVLCTPHTSEDGVRPRVALGDVDTDDTEATAVPNRFLDVCNAAGDNYALLKRQLRMCLRHARRDGSGWVLYATQSMNPVENEAVVCATIAEMRKEKSGGATGGAVAWDVECVPLTSHLVETAFPHADELASLREWLHTSGTVGGGLTGWAALEGGPPDQEADAHPPQLRAEVAEASWRSVPSMHGHNGGYLCLLRVRPLVQLSQGAGTRPASEGKRSTLVLSSGGATHGTAALMSTATARFVDLMGDASRPSLPSTGVPSGPPITHGTVWRVGAAGLPIGEALPLHGKEDTTLALSSAVSGSTALARWISESDTACLATSLPRAGVSALMLSELLLIRQQQPHTMGEKTSLTDGPLRHRLFQLSQRSDEEGKVERAMEQAEINALFDVVHKLHKQAGGDTAVTQTVVLVPTVPTHLLGITEEGLQLHDAVGAELAQVHVVVRLHVEPVPLSPRHRSPRYSSERGWERFPFRFSLSMPTVSTHHAERPLHEMAMTEVCVGLRDALLYVLRRVRCPLDRLPHLGASTYDQHGMAREDTGGGAAVDTVRRPDVRTVLHLEDDEFSVEPPMRSGMDATDILSPRETAHKQGRLDRMERALRRHGGVRPDGSPAKDDWEQTVPTTYRQRWRRSGHHPK